MTRRTDKPLPLPLIAALLALGLWGKDYVAEQGSGRGVEHAGYPNPRIVGSASYEGQPASATPVWGVDGKGVAYVIEPNPRYPLLHFEMRLPR